MTHERAKDALRRVGVRPTRERGQNFLIDQGALDTIVAFGNPSSQDYLVEIGPGLGALTERLVPCGLQAALELEEAFCRDLRLRFPHLRLLQGDAREADLAQFGVPVTVFSNLPYSISTDMVMTLIRQHRAVRRAVLLLQREFAERCAAPPGGRVYGTLSIAVQLRCEVTLGPIIGGASFHPPTTVDSRLIELRMLGEPRIALDDEAFFRRVVSGAFLQRRRKLPNSLAAAGFGDVESLRALCRENGIDPARRAETLSLEEFGTLTRILGERLRSHPEV